MSIYPSISSLCFVPKHHPLNNLDFQKLQSFFNKAQKLFILTGAGISTESGIPDYRSEGVGLYAKSSNRPVQYKDFISSAKVRQRYWARNFLGWFRFSSVKPNASHIALKKWEDYGKVSVIVTQNVDRLHTKAGSKYVIELHGSAFDVICLSCSFRILRLDLQEQLKLLNPSFVGNSSVIRPDGDVELHQEQIQDFQVPSCPKCQGVLKPDIVFFGDNVPKPRVDQVQNILRSSDSLLVIGSSLEVFSGYRFILTAKELNLPIAIVNIGKTRADQFADLKINARSGEILPKILME